MRPKSYGSSTIGVKKSTLDTSARSSEIRYTAASSAVSAPTSTAGSSLGASSASSGCSSAAGILQAQPAPCERVVSLTGGTLLLSARVAEPRFTDEQVDAAVEALTEPERFREAEMRVTRIAPQLQRILAQALSEGGWFGEAHESEVRKAAAGPDDAARAAQIKTLLAEETRMGMLVGVAIGWELARVLEMEPDDKTGD